MALPPVGSSLSSLVTDGWWTPYDGTRIETFDTGDTLDLSRTGGTVTTAGSPPGGSVGTNYLLLTSGQTSTVDFAQASNYFGFLWGSPEQNPSTPGNQQGVRLYSGANLVGTYTADSLGLSGTDSYVNFFADSANPFTRAEFFTHTNLEVDNLAIWSATDTPPAGTNYGTNLVVNGSFEAEDIPTGSVQLVDITGWKSFNSDLVEVHDSFVPPNPQTGPQYAELTNQGVRQTISVTAGKTYQLDFAYRYGDDGSAADNGFEVWFKHLNLGVVNPVQGQPWQHARYTFVASNSGGPLEFQKLSGFEVGEGAHIDGVQLRELIPGAPIVSAPATLAATEDVTSNLVYSGTPFSDSNSTNLRVTLSIADGTITGNAAAGISVGGTDTERTFIGSVTALNSYFTTAGNITYTSAPDANGTRTLTTTASDGTLSASATTTLNIGAVNDAPLISAPGAQSTLPGAPLVFSSANGNLVSISDVDAGTSPLQVQLGVSNGTLSLSGTSGLTFTAGANGTSTMTVQGSAADLNTALSGMSYTAAANFSGTVNLSITASDLGNAGSGGVLTDTKAIAITVASSNTAPTVSAPGGFTVTEDVASNLLYTGAPFADVDGDNLTVTLAIEDGTITGNAGSGITVGGSATERTFSGSAADLNSYFTTAGSITYTSAPNANGSRTLTTAVSDGSLSTSTTSTVAITPVNDAPLTSVPGAQSTPEETELVFSAANGSLISLGDIDAGTSPLQVELGVTQGVLNLSGTSGLTFSAGANGSSTMTVTGTAASLNAALDGLRYTPNAQYSGPETLSITLSDLGNTGIGGILTDTQSVAITVTPVNDPPSVTAPASFTVMEDVASNLLYTGTPFADVDGDNLTVTLSIADGTVSGQTAGGVTVGGSATERTFSGSAADLNSYFTTAGSITYTSAPNANGLRTLTTAVSDGSLSTATTSIVTVSPVNDAPSLTAPTSFTVTKNSTTQLRYTGTPFADVDSGSLTVTLSVADGVITGNAASGITIGGTATARIFSGSQADLNAYFTQPGNIIYAPKHDNTVARVLTTTVQDGESSASALSTIFIATPQEPTVGGGLPSRPLSGSQRRPLPTGVITFERSIGPTSPRGAAPLETFDASTPRQLSLRGGIAIGPGLQQPFGRSLLVDDPNESAMAVGLLPGRPGAEKMTIDLSSRPTTRLGLMWRGAHVDNAIELYAGERLLRRLSAAEVFADAPAGSAPSAFVTFMSLDGTRITRAVVSSSAPFQVDNVTTEEAQASVAAPPAPKASRSIFVNFAASGQTFKPVTIHPNQPGFRSTTGVAESSNLSRLASSGTSAAAGTTNAASPGSPIIFAEADIQRAALGIRGWGSLASSAYLN